MKHLFAILLAVVAVLNAGDGGHAYAKEGMSRQVRRSTVSEGMRMINRHFGVNFIYDSSLEQELAGPASQISDMDGKSLEECMDELLTGTAIGYEINNRYIVLTRAGQKKRPKNYTIFIEEQRDTLMESRITAVVDIPVNSTQTGMEHIDGSKLNRGYSFFSSPDVIKTLQTLPGVSAGTELLSGLYVHGGTGSDNLYLMDGVHLYSVGHLGGLFSSFNSDVIDNVDFYKSGFPARYGGRMSSVVDVTTRDGDFNDYKGTFSVGLIEGRFQMEGPIVKGKTSFNIGLRRSWLDVLTVPAFMIYNATRDKMITSHTSMRYAMTDFNGKLTHKFSDNNILSLSLFAGQDALSFRAKSDRVKWENEGYEELMDIRLRWGNIMGSLLWKNRVSDEFRYSINLYHVQSRSDLGLRDSFKSKEDDGTVSVSDDSDSNASLIYDTGLKADFNWIPSDVHHVRFGTEAIWHLFNPKRISERTYEQSGSSPVNERNTEGFRYHGAETSLYAEDEMTLTDWLSANAGLRYVMFFTDGKAYHRLEPRAALRFRLGGLASLKMSYSDMNQFNHRLTTSFPLELPTSVWMPSTAEIAPMHSRQYSLGAYFNLPYDIKLEVEGWYKTMDNIRQYVGLSNMYPPVDEWEEHYTEGNGRSYGLETNLQWSDENTSVSLGYTLSWSERYFARIHDEWFPDMFDNRHKIDLSVTRKLGKRTELYAGWTFHSGNRMTLPTQILPIPSYDDDYDYVKIYDSPNNAILPAYHRLDLGFNFHKTTKRGNESVWNLSVYNAYCHMNAINGYVSAAYESDSPDITSFYSEMEGWIPIIPTFSYTLKF